MIRHNDRYERTHGYCSDVVFDQALSWIEKSKDAGQPFFAYITPNAPHEPLICPDEYQRMYRGLNLDENTQKYFGMCTNIDDSVGKLMNGLTDQNRRKQLGVADVPRQRRRLVVRRDDGASQFFFINGAVSVRGIRSSRATLNRTPRLMLGETGNRST